MSKRSTVVYLTVRRAKRSPFGDAHIVSAHPSRGQVPAGSMLIPLRLTIDDAWFTRQAEMIEVDVGKPPEQPKGEVA
ncbi:MAG: hypothetical protein AB7K86_08405 [Rhodospirillales bacterium]